jgi:hypothetical protein
MLDSDKLQLLEYINVIINCTRTYTLNTAVSNRDNKDQIC